MNKHSPGPWKETGNGHGETVTEHQTCWIWDANGNKVATVYDREVGDGPLIASAPTMKIELDCLRAENSELKRRLKIVMEFVMHEDLCPFPRKPCRCGLAELNKPLLGEDYQ